MVRGGGDGQGPDHNFVNQVSTRAATGGIFADQHREPPTPWVSSLLSYAILLGGILTITTTLYLVATSYSNLPYWDGWSQIEVVANGQSPFSPAWLWELHNEHRLVLPKLFLAIDLRLFQARQVFLLASIFVIQLLHWGLLSWSMRALGGWRGALWRTGAGLAAFCLFCPSQRENFVWGFQVCFVLPQLFATVSFVALLLYWAESQRPPEERPSSKFLVVSVLAALAATYSLANGTLLWPLLLVAALYLRLRMAAILSFVVTGVLSTALYFYRYVRPEDHASPIASLGAPVALFKYWAVYFLSAWSHRGMGDSEGIALVGLTVVAALLLPALSYVGAFRPFAIQLALTMAFCLGTALITAAGRVNFGIVQAFSSRYQTVALLFWCCVGLLWLGCAFFARPQMRYGFLVLQVCLLAIFVRGAVIAQYPVREMRRHAFAQNAIAASLLTGIYDPETLSESYPEMGLLRKVVPYMKANRLSVFSDDAGSELGKPLESIFPLASPEDCAGSFESVVRVDDPSGRGLRILGWAIDRKRRDPALTVVATTDGVITGLGAVGKWRPDVRAVEPGLTSSYIGFVAFVPESPPGAVVKLYAILHGNPPAACDMPLK